MSQIRDLPPGLPGSEPSSDIRAAVGDLRARGFAVCRVRRGDKTPDHAGWPTGSLRPEDFRDGDAVGIVCGWPSDGNVPGHAVVCIDLDSPDAVARADDFLPATGMIEGRPGKPRSHRYYLVPVGNLSPDDTSTAPIALAGAIAAGKHPGPRSRRFTLPDGSEALAVKGSGALAVCPPSSHPSGESRGWEGGGIGEPARVDYRDLLDAAARLAAAVGCRAGNPGRSTPAGPRAVRDQSPADRGGTTEQFALLAAAGRGASVRVGGREFGPSDRVERGRRYLAAIPDDDLSRSGRGGHATFFRHARLLANDFLVRDRPALAELLAGYNARLRALDLARPGEGFEPWSGTDLAHKLDDALDGGVVAEFPPGCKLAAATPGGAPPREVTGACLDVHLRVKFFALLVGEGENGKSAFLAVLRSLLGTANVASVGLDDLARNRFATFGLLGKLANLVGDQGYVELADEGKLKQLTGGDLVTFEQKNRDPIFAVNAAKIIVAANSPPTFGDKSPAVWSRLQLVPFDHVVPPGRRDPTLLDGRTWAGELPGVLNWALDGLARLHANGRFTDCPRVRAARDCHRADSNPARAFLLGHFRETGDATCFVATDAVYAAYRE